MSGRPWSGHAFERLISGTACDWLTRGFFADLLHPFYPVPDHCWFTPVPTTAYVCRHLTRVINSRLTGFTPSLSRKFTIAQKRTVASTWNLAELLLLQSDMVCENIYMCDGQFRDMSDFMTSLQATFDRKVTEVCESVKTQRRICKCNCKWKLPKDVKWRNLQGGYLGFCTLGGFDPEVSRNPFLNCPQIQLK